MLADLSGLLQLLVGTLMWGHKELQLQQSSEPLSHSAPRCKALQLLRSRCASGVVEPVLQSKSTASPQRSHWFWFGHSTAGSSRGQMRLVGAERCAADMLPAEDPDRLLW